MMRKNASLIVFLVSMISTNASAATDLWQVYEQSLTDDPTILSAKDSQLAVHQNVPVARASFFPSITATTYVSPTSYSAVSAGEGHTNIHAYEFSLSQTVFDYTDWASYRVARLQSQQSDISYDSSLQELMLTVAERYFDVLEAEDNEKVNEAEVKAFKQSMDAIYEEYKVGVKPVSDYLDAKSSYDVGRAGLIASKNAVQTSLESLSELTGAVYKHLYPLKEKIPLFVPAPHRMAAWQKMAENNNLTYLTDVFATKIAEGNISVERAGHFPTLALSATAGRYKFGNSTLGTSGKDNLVTLTLSVPVFSGGLVTAETRQAIDDYSSAQQDEIGAKRAAVSDVRQYYLGVNTDIHLINAYETAVLADQTSLNATEAGYKVGVNTVLDVLESIQQLYEDKLSLSQERYTYINDILNLKSAAGTLSVTDLRLINSWLDHQHVT